MGGTMSTRSSVIINYGQTQLIIYRHWDGYIEEAGKDLATKLNGCYFDDDRKYFNIAKFVSKLLIDDDTYRITTQLHGDLEYCYIFNFDDAYEHGGHYNRVKLKNIIIDQNHKYGKGGTTIFKTLRGFKTIIYDLIAKRKVA